MTLAIIIISFCIVFYINKANKNEEKLHENLLLVLFFIASVIWSIKSIIDLYRYGILVFSPNQAVFVKDTMTGIIVVASCLVLWIIYVVINDKNIKSNDKTVNTIENDKKEMDTPLSHQAPSITIDDYDNRSSFNPYNRYDHYNE